LIEKSFVALGISQSDTRMSAAAGRGTHKPPASKPPPHRNSAKPGKSSTSPAKSAKPATAAATTATTTTATTTTTTDSISKSSSSSSALSSSSSSSSTTLAHRSACVAVFDANFTAVNVERGLPMFGDGTSFLVVGVVGRVGVGKSTLASLLLGNDTVFPVRSMHDQLAARHCTVGVDVAVSSDRVILLDMQPILCATLSNASAIEQSLLAWLLAVCHVVVVVSGSASFGSHSPSLSSPAPVNVPPSEPKSAKASNKTAAATSSSNSTSADDANWRATRGPIESVSFGTGHAGGTWPSMRAALMQRRGMPCVSVLDKIAPASIDIAKHDAERCATAVFAFTKLPSRTLEDWRMARHTHMTATSSPTQLRSRSPTPSCCCRATLQRRRRAASLGVWQRSSSLPTRATQPMLQRTAAAPGASYVMMPRRPQRADDAGWRAYNEAAEVFRTTVLSAPRHKFVRAGLSERQWWRNAATAWQLLSTSSKATQEFAKVCNTLGQAL
jgi:hypothetical protein